MDQKNLNSQKRNQKLLKIFEDKESSGNPQAIGDNGKAWGLFQFHKARWIECGGKLKDYRIVGRVEQERVMKNALKKYSNFPKGLTEKQKIYWIANWHNIGHGSLKETKYASDFWRRWTLCKT